MSCRRRVQTDGAPTRKGRGGEGVTGGKTGGREGGLGGVRAPRSKGTRSLQAPGWKVWAELREQERGAIQEVEPLTSGAGRSWSVTSKMRGVGQREGGELRERLSLSRRQVLAARGGPR